ncbi:hypothetical protein HBJ00_22730, partial [Aeromonas veronii]|nr:hypothetical protein [Aeromonas veronii]
AVAAVVASSLSLSNPVAAVESTFTPPCVDDPVALGPEEELVTKPAPRELLRSSGLADFVTAFAEDLCARSGEEAIDALVENRSRELWTRGI